MNMSDIYRTAFPSASAAPAVTAGTEGFSMGRLVLLMAGAKRFIGALTIAFGAVAALVALLLPNYYTATTTLMPPQQNRSVAGALLAQLGSFGTSLTSESGIKDPNDVFIVILQSRTVGDALSAKFDLAKVYRKRRPEDVLQALADATQIRTMKGGVIKISVEDRSPVRAAEIANAYAAEMYKVNGRLAVVEAAQRRAFYEQQLESARSDLLQAAERFKKSEQSTGIVALEAQAKGIVEGAGALQQQVAAKEAQVQAMQVYATGQNRNFKLAQAELAALRAQLAKIENHRRDWTLDVPASKLPAATTEYAAMSREVKYAEAVVETIAKQYQIARIDEAKSAAVIQAIDPAVVPSKKSRPNRLVLILGAMMSGLVIAVAWVLGRDSYRSNPAAWTTIRTLLENSRQG